MNTASEFSRLGVYTYLLRQIKHFMVYVTLFKGMYNSLITS